MSRRAGHPDARRRGERGQASVEWIGLVLVVALLALGLLAVAGARLPGGLVARAILERIVCAAKLDGACGDRSASALALAYGVELAERLREHAPDLLYEEGMVALPVDFRRCRRPACSDGDRTGLATRSSSGEPTVAFVHVVDCRERSISASRELGYACDGRRQGNVYLQYWFYYPTSSTGRVGPVRPGFHADDWESYAVRISPGGVDARASSHRGYNYELGFGNAGSDAGWKPVKIVAEAAGLRPRGGWGPETGALHVSGGSHAGNVKRDGYVPPRTTPGARLVLIPIESLGDEERSTPFAVVPPWLKAVYADPEADGT